METRAESPTIEAVDPRPIFITSLIGTTIFSFVSVAAICWPLFGPTVALGLGGMCAAWGGPGFGAMVGGAWWSLAKHSAAEKAETAEGPVAAAAAEAGDVVASPLEDVSVARLPVGRLEPQLAA